MKKIKSLDTIDPDVKLIQSRLMNIKEIFNKIGGRDITEDEQTQISTLLNDICDMYNGYDYVLEITPLCILIVINDFSYDDLNKLLGLLIELMEDHFCCEGRSMADNMFASVVEIRGMMIHQRCIGVNGWRTRQMPKGTDRCLSYLKYQEDDCTD